MKKVAISFFNHRLITPILLPRLFGFQMRQKLFLFIKHAINIKPARRSTKFGRLFKIINMIPNNNNNWRCFLIFVLTVYFSSWDICHLVKSVIYQKCKHKILALFVKYLLIHNFLHNIFQRGHYPDLVATSGDYLRVWNVSNNNEVKLEALLNNVSYVYFISSYYLRSMLSKSIQFNGLILIAYSI